MHRLAVVCALFAAACGSNSELVIVDVRGDRSGLVAVVALVKLDGRQDTEGLERFAAGVTDFGLTLPAGASGPVEIDVAGLDANNCIVSIATVSTQATGAARTDVTVTLSAVSPPQC